MFEPIHPEDSLKNVKVLLCTLESQKAGVQWTPATSPEDSIIRGFCRINLLLGNGNPRASVVHRGLSAVNSSAILIDIRSPNIKTAIQYSRPSYERLHRKARLGRIFSLSSALIRALANPHIASSPTAVQDGTQNGNSGPDCEIDCWSWSSES